MKFDSIALALEELKKGKPIIVLDDENRENEGDLVAVTEWMQDDTINFMAKNGRGLICAPISKEIATQAGLNPMVYENNDPHKTAFTQSIDHVSSTTGISAFERTQTARALIQDGMNERTFNQPGHIFPLIAKDNGVLARRGHTEAAVDLALLTNAKPAGVICEIMNEDGTMARGEQLQDFKEKHQLKMITIEALVSYIKVNRKLIKQEAKVKLPTRYGTFDMIGFTSEFDGQEHLAIIKGEIQPEMNVRIHSACATGDIFHSERCDCGEQLEKAMQYIHEHGGIILYLPQEGRGIGLMNKLKAYELIEQGYNTVTANEALGFEPDLRDYDIAAQMLKHLGVSSVNLLSNNPEKFEGLKKYHIDITGRVPLITCENENNHDYLEVKKTQMGHLI
ncbi:MULTISPECIES: bifunctional 3,4-dihydroxy-2-butanone-4-phosphate synthase/GTP cyclohydrolase II [Staphylococcus]|uniref:Riboflavin biosynthesis protein RibBA n=1 Tax=Staphylococcus agnetis TaxID=985762 RepID=A0A2T4MJQ9_9STAP|nr:MULTISPECIES: bifunctional 3,4-dihydroxy-2-butanone-4-phosphate synthase/GTP cyclohydrolase II [Staphylococcus]ALN76712.1 bifunctional 3,4-dihydroxy-2-butanone-4-phosphate synthase/GTP cyclohydrolase II [Staphylococcus agnetis]NHM93028.1 bifunctional 3,4-dihydroxy-2-butanone-4-phosphate synthase/GTP cyclohydrolase II [Staphylococcus sp. 10602379]NJI03551.1 bifunctional 3,4-dihydroxy-2-butanone-4-phosphate synthase/GTP cyclohydrolase II [Staphylococcus agnetis]OSP20467.1 bifunctional 3,4-dihy